MSKIESGKLKDKVNNKIDNINEEIKELENKRNKINQIFTTIYIALFFWIVSGFYISGNEIIWGCMLVFIVWCSYYFIFYVIRAHRNIYVSVKTNFTKYINLNTETRDDIHNSIDKLTPHFSKRSQHSRLMSFVILTSLIIIVVAPYTIQGITINLYGDNELIMIFLFLIIIVKLIIISQPTRSLKYFHETEKQVESAYKDEKLREIASNRKVQNAAVWIMAIVGSLPSLFCIGSIIYFSYLNRAFFDLQLTNTLVILFILLITSYLMQKYSHIIAQLSIGKEIKNSLYVLLNRIEHGKIRSTKKIENELEEILYTRFKI